MHIELINTGKRYNTDWIFRRLSYTFEPGNAYAITGPNGSGKSTLLQVIGGAVLHSEGSIKYSTDKEIEPVNAYRHITMAAPYLELVEEMNPIEFLSFHQGFKKLNESFEYILKYVGLYEARQKEIRYFSSGMKQRLKLAQAIFSDAPVLLLDEPTTNLDSIGIELYQSLIRDHTNGKLIIVSSNDPAEYKFCKKSVCISDYKLR